MTLVAEIKRIIEKCIDEGKHIAIFPMGDLGIQTQSIMKEVYGISPRYRFDNKLCKYNKEIHAFSDVSDLDMDNTIIILAVAQDNNNIEVLRNQIGKQNLKYYEIMWPNNEFEKAAIGKVGEGRANEDSMLDAIFAAVKMVRNRQ